MRPLPPTEDWLESIRAGRIDWLSRAITLMENSRPDARQAAQHLLQALLPFTGKALRIGISGPPGVGKSSFIEAWGINRADSGEKVAVLAVDPSSSRTRGSILGDKTRMGALAMHPQAYVRPSPAGSTLGGVARATREALLVCDAAGFDLIIVETVGVGQSETLVHGMVDVYLVLLQAGGGDELQGIKRGILELADHVLVTKADGDNLPAAKRAAADFRSAFSYMPPQEDGWKPEVALCSAHDGSGLYEFNAKLAELVAHRKQHKSWQSRRNQQRLIWFQQSLEEQLLSRLHGSGLWQERKAALEHAVLESKLTPWQAAAELLGE